MYWKATYIFQLHACTIAESNIASNNMLRICEKLTVDGGGGGGGGRGGSSLLRLKPSPPTFDDPGTMQA